MSDQLVVMNGGVIEQVGTPIEVYRRPATRFVATFIGSPPMNILRGRVEGLGLVSADSCGIRVSDMRERLGLRHAGRHRHPARGRSDCSAWTSEATLRLDIDFVEELGATQLFHGKIAGTEFVVQAPTGRIAPDARRLAIAVDPASVHLFDPETGERLGRADDPTRRAAP